MNPKIHRGFLPLILVSLIAIGIPGCVCQTQNDYETCRQSFDCGGLRDIRYPFYGGNRSLSCGYGGFELICEGEGDPLVNISSITYRVLEINNQTKTLRVARNDLWANLCSPLRINTTLNTTLYTIYSSANDQEVNLVYGCSISQTPSIPFPSQFNCSGNGNGINGLAFFYLTQINLPSGNNITCSGPQISVRVNQSEAALLGVNPSAALLQTSLQTGFSIQWSLDDQNCNDCVRSGGSCGFDETSSSFACHCTNASFPSTCTNTTNPNGRKSIAKLLVCGCGSGNGLSDLHKFVIIGVSLGVPGLGISFITIFCIIKKYRLLYEDQEINQNVEKFLLTHGSLAPKRYSYNEIKNMTKSFREKLGQGGYGIVYKGELPDGQLVAVKVLSDIHEHTEDFINEVASISRTSHVNIVNLLGFSYQRKKRALVYEFMPNKSLDKFIHKRGSTDTACSLEMDKLYEIALGVARGLEYLHRGCNTRIVHFDIKPQNILLDEDFCPKISDFGLAKLFKQKQSAISMFGARGTIGYIAPEVFSRNFGVVSHKSDVYSYGMMLLEMAEAGKMVEIEPIQSSETYFPEKIYEHVLLKNKNLDDVVTDEKEETQLKMLMVGLWCIQTAPSDRPSMSKVVEMLEGSLLALQIPPKPFFSSLEPLQFSSSMHTDTEKST